MNLKFDLNLFHKTAEIDQTIIKQVGAMRSQAVAIRNRLISTNEVARLQQKAAEENLLEWASVVVTDGEEPTSNKFSKKKEKIFEDMKEQNENDTKHSTQEWIMRHMAKGCLSKLTVGQRKTIGKRRPAVEYDILPPSLSNSPFVVQFDMENPRPRFVIKHRFLSCDYGLLPPDHKVELVRIALNFAERFGIKDTMLKIPMIASSNIQTIYGKFYAYLVCPNLELYIRLFQFYVKDSGIPFWPSTARWVTPLWIPEASPQVDDSCYVESLMVNTGLYPDIETDLLSRHHFNFKNISSAVVSEEQITDFETFSWEEKLIVGVKSSDFFKSSPSPLDRWQFLDFMYGVLADVQKRKPHTKCTMVLSLARPFLLRRHKSLALIRFKDKLPHNLKSKWDMVEHNIMPRTILDDLSYITYDLDLENDSWVLIEDVVNNNAGARPEDIQLSVPPDATDSGKVGNDREK